MNATFNISLDVHRAESQVSIPMFMGDSGHTIVANLTEDGKPFHLSDNCNVYFSGVKADGNPLYNECDVDNGKIVYDLKKTTSNGETCQTTAFPGVVKCQFKIIDEDGAILSSPRFTIIVEDTVNDEKAIVDSATEVNVLVNMIADIQSKLDNNEFDGKDGEDGEDGEDGYTPVKGVDYYTELEKKELVNEILSNFVDGDEVAY